MIINYELISRNISLWKKKWRSVSSQDHIELILNWSNSCIVSVSGFLISLQLAAVTVNHLHLNLWWVRTWWSLDALLQPDTRTVSYCKSKFVNLGIFKVKIEPSFAFASIHDFVFHYHNNDHSNVYHCQLLYLLHR